MKSSSAPRVRHGLCRAPREPLLLNVGADIEVELHQQGPVVALLRLELVDLVEHARDRSPRRSGRARGRRARADTSCERRSRCCPRSAAGARSARANDLRLASRRSKRSRMDGEMAGVERGRELLAARISCPTPSEPFEQDDRAAAVRDLRQLQLGKMLAQRSERRARSPLPDAATLDVSHSATSGS